MKKIEDQKSWTPDTTHPPSTIHHPNKIKISGIESEILIKYKRIKWTPSGKASLLSSRGDKQKSSGSRVRS